MYMRDKDKDAGMKSKEVERTRGEGGGRHRYRHVEGDVPLRMRRKVEENDEKSGDFNAELGPGYGVERVSVGPHTLNEENKRGVWMKQWLMTQNFTAPNTMYRKTLGKQAMYIHSPVARTFFCCAVCLRTSAHLHRMSIFVLHLAFSLLCTCVSFLHLALSSFMSHPSLLFLDGHFETIPDFDVHTFLPYLPVLKAQGMRISARGREVWLSVQVRPQHRL